MQRHIHNWFGRYKSKWTHTQHLMHNMRLMIETCTKSTNPRNQIWEYTLTADELLLFIWNKPFFIWKLNLVGMLWYVIWRSNMWSTKWQDENQNRVEEPMNTNQHINSIKEQNNLQINRQNMLFRKKTNLEKEFGIFPFSSAWDCIELMSRRTIYKERDGYTYIWVIVFTYGLENNLHELLYYNIFLFYPPFAYAISSLAHMELLNCLSPRQPLEGAHWHMSSVHLRTAWFHTQLDSKT